MMKKLLLILTLFIFTQANQSNSFELERYSYIGNIKKVKEYLQKSKTIPDQAILNAGYKNHSEIVKLLLKNGSDIQVQSYSGRNILYYAVQNNNLELLKYLVRNGGKFAYTNYGYDVMFEAVRDGYIDIVKFLLPYFKDLNRYYFLMNPASDVRTSLLTTAIQNDNLDIAKLLINNGANINFVNNRGETPILTALRNKHFNMARFLISKGVDLKAQDIAGNNAFTYAVILRQEDIALKTLEFVDINQLVGYNIFDGKPYIYEYYIFETKKDWQFANYLHLASRYGQTKIIKKLLAKGLKIDTLLKDKQYKMDILQIAIYYGDVKTVKFLIENGANQYKLYNSSLPWGSYKTLLSYSMIVANKTKKRQEIIKYLLSLPKASWYKKYENIDKINKFLNKKIEVYKDNSDERLAEGIKNNDYLDVIHSTKHNDKLISSLKQMLKLKHNINKEIFKKYNYEGTLLVEYFKAMENNINIKDIKKLVSLGATLGNSQQALENIYLLYSNRAVKYILKDKLFQKQIINLHTKYNITDIAIKIYKNERRSNHRIELMFELVYKYNLNFDFEEFKKVVKKDDNYIIELIKYYNTRTK